VGGRDELEKTRWCKKGAGGSALSSGAKDARSPGGFYVTQSTQSRSFIGEALGSKLGSKEGAGLAKSDKKDADERGEQEKKTQLGSTLSA